LNWFSIAIAIAIAISIAIPTVLSTRSTRKGKRAGNFNPKKHFIQSLGAGWVELQMRLSWFLGVSTSHFGLSQPIWPIGCAAVSGWLGFGCQVSVAVLMELTPET
jgi:hypothetical protein